MLQSDRNVCRPHALMLEAGRFYPGAWAKADKIRAEYWATGTATWPSWCDLPHWLWTIITAHEIGPLQMRNPVTHFRAMGDSAIMAALGIWRMTQGIYRFDEMLYAALIDTPMDMALPGELLLRLPEWCVYIETPSECYNGMPIYGAWVHLDYRIRSGGDTAIHIVLDMGRDCRDLLPLSLRFTSGMPIAELFEQSLQETRALISTNYKMALPEAGNDEKQAIRAIITRIASLTLYICSTNADITGRIPKNPEFKKTKRGWKLFPAPGPAITEVGVRLGAALKAAYAQQQGGQTGTHASPAPHFRRAHWHTFVVGPRNSPTRQLRWLPPIPVKFDPSHLVPTIRQVTPG